MISYVYLNKGWDRGFESLSLRYAKGEVKGVYKETLKYGFQKVSESDYNYARGLND